MLTATFCKQKNAKRKTKPVKTIGSATVSQTSFGGYDYNTYAIAECVGSSVKNQGPSGSLFRSVIWSEFFTIVYHHDVFIWAFKLHGLVVIQNLMSKVIG